ncbi:MAG: EthD family reductase [Candidatus Rokubacteria bacterium]|nr:EthD family reductase [Candidatus Rokubacteria bacterium]
MIKIVAIVKRKPGMAVEPFQEYWRTRHADVVRKLPGVRRYVQSHTLLAGYRKGEPAWDGIAELWFDDTHALRALRGTPEQAAIDADEARFLDRSAMKMLATDEDVVIDGPIPEGSVKSIEFVTHRPDLAIDAFQRYWRETHGPIAARIPQIRRYVQSHVRASAYAGGRTPAYDGLAITWFDDTAAMRAAAATPEYARTRADEANFISGELPFIITREIVVV